MSDFDAIPAELRDRDQWLLWDAAADTPRRPHWRGNFGISWSDPDDWHSFEAAVSAAEERESWGIGYVMALDNDDHARGLYGCLDLDGCVEDPDGRRGPKDWLPSLAPFIQDDAYMEYSPSSEGIHIPLVGQEPPEWWRDSHFSAEEHEGVEYLTNKFVTFTGDAMKACAGNAVTDTDPAPFLHKAYEELNDASPVENSSHDYDESDAEGDLSEREIRDALDHVDSSVPYPQWRDILFAIHDWDASATGRNVAEDWSMGPGWDDQADELIEKIWSGASQGDGITVGTLIHKASENGWSSSRDERADGASVDPEADADAEGDEWGLIRLRLREASDADERDRPRFDAAMKLHTDYEFLTLEANDQLYVYDDDTGIYNDNGEGVVRTELTDGLEEQYRAHAMSEALDHIRGRTVIPKDDIGGPAGYVAADNCVIDLDNGEAREIPTPTRRGSGRSYSTSCPRSRIARSYRSTPGTRSCTGRCRTTRPCSSSARRRRVSRRSSIRSTRCSAPIPSLPSRRSSSPPNDSRARNCSRNGPTSATTSPPRRSKTRGCSRRSSAATR